MRERQISGIRGRFPWVGRVEAAIANLPREERYLVGVSGGVDSRALLHLLPKIGFCDLVVCHLNHNLRGVESLEDSKFVYRLARRLQLPFYTENLARLPDTGSLEEAARQVRFEFFARAADKYSTSSLFLAHHADDQIETFLFNLFRGTGSLDNAAIKAKSHVVVGTRDLLVCRPLLKVWKYEILEFVRTFHLKFREDSTNVSRQMVRNRIRLDLIPELEKLMGRQVKGALLRTIEIAADEGELLRSLVPEIGDELEIQELRKLTVAIQRRTIHRWLRSKGIKDCGFDEIESVRSLLTRLEIAKINLPGNVFCRRKAGRLFVEW